MKYNMKFNVGDKVRIKKDLSKCEFGYCGYMEEFVGKEAIVTSTFGKGIIKLDIDEQVWDWSENVLELIERNKVNESDLKDADVESITIGQALQSIYDIPPQIKINSDKIKEVNVNNENDPVNPFMEEYKKIVTETMNLCEKKNKDYGNATDESFKQFGDVSYQVRCFDKWSRINTLLKNGKAEVSESLEDSLLDLSNYLFLWVTSRRLKENN